MYRMKIITKNKRRRRKERRKKEDGEFSACALKWSRRDDVEKLWRQNGPSPVIVHCAFVSAVGYRVHSSAVYTSSFMFMRCIHLVPTSMPMQCTYLAICPCGVHI